MKNFPLLLFFALILCFAVLGQTDETALCPAISIEVGQFPSVNEPFTFTASVGKEIEKYNVKYQWTVSSGEIIEGQGTTQIKVPRRSLCDINLTATLEITGLPKTCPFTESETGSVSDCFTRPILAEEYGKILFGKEKNKLDAVAARLSADEYLSKSATVYFIIYLTNKQKSAEIKSRRANIEKYLSTVHKIPKDKISFVFNDDNNFGDYWTKIFIVPPGIENPQP